MGKLQQHDLVHSNVINDVVKPALLWHCLVILRFAPGLACRRHWFEATRRSRKLEPAVRPLTSDTPPTRANSTSASRSYEYGLGQVRGAALVDHRIPLPQEVEGHTTADADQGAGQHSKAEAFLDKQHWLTR